MSVESKQGEGSVFSFNVPAVSNFVMDKDNAFDGLKIMVVNVWLDSLTQLQAMFKTLGVPACDPVSAQDAYGTISEGEIQFDVVFLSLSATSGAVVDSIVEVCKKKGILLVICSEHARRPSRRGSIVMELAKKDSIKAAEKLMLPPNMPSIVNVLIKVLKRKVKLIEEKTKQGDLEKVNLPTTEELKEKFAKGNINVFVAEDNRVNQQVVKNFLTRLSINCTIAGDGQVMVDLVKNNPSYHIILMDCQMPVMDGYDATKEICALMEKNEIKKCPILALTANALEAEKEKCLECGMSDFLTKPIRYDVLAQTLNKWLDM